jgi:asparagine synthase (glutamine-hydrolysing)
VDQRVAEFAATLPEDANVRRSGSRGWQGKLLLKKLLRKYLPDELIERPKKGFSIPLRAWFDDGSPVRSSLEDRISDPQSPLREFFELDAMRTVMVEQRSTQMWQLLVLDEWFRQNRTWSLPDAPSEDAIDG